MRTSKHHIYPRSRCKDCGIKHPDKATNVVIIEQSQHEHYHALFHREDGMPMTPDEIIEYLNEYLWGGRVRAEIVQNSIV